MKAQPKKPKQKSLAWHKAKCDTKLSLYIRARDKRCVVCGNPENLQNGHYFGRRYLATRFDFRNCNCQCAGCNILHNENPEPYRRYMIAQYGPVVIGELEVLTRIGTKMTRANYLALEAEIDRRMKELE